MTLRVPFANKIRERYFLEDGIDNGGRLEVWSRALNEGRHDTGYGDKRERERLGLALLSSCIL